MAFKVPLIPPKRRLEDAEGIDSFALSETEKNKVIGKVAFASAQWRRGCPKRNAS